MPMDDDPDRTEMQALCDHFRELMRSEPDPPLFRKDACQRIGEMLGRSARLGRPYHAYDSPR
jgi:hypothetical protein